MSFFPLSSLFVCHTFMFTCFCASFKSLKKLPLHHSLQQMLLAGAEVDVKERHIFPKDCECVQLKQLQNWLHSASGELKRVGEDFGLKIKIVFKILEYFQNKMSKTDSRNSYLKCICFSLFCVIFILRFLCLVIKLLHFIILSSHCRLFWYFLFIPYTFTCHFVESWEHRNWPKVCHTGLG